MASASKSFDFSERYRNMQPTAERSIVEAREIAHKTIVVEAPKSVTKIVDLTRVAFSLPVPPERDFDGWFGKAVKKGDKHFSLQIDKEEAARIATLALSSLVSSGYYGVAALVIAASVAGRRESPGNNEIVQQARTGLAEAPRRRGVAFSATVTTPQVKDISALFAAVVSSGDPQTIKSAIEGVHADARSVSAALVSSVNQTLQTLTNENRRLAEEVDLLWWHLGGHSFLLDVPFSSLPEEAVPMVIGADVAAMVTALPGPYGAYGIIRKALGATADHEQSIVETVGNLPTESRSDFLGNKPFEADDLAILHGAVKAAGSEEVVSLGPRFEKITAINAETKFTRYELALQAYHERLFIKHGWL
ncbi:hypothetical protein HB774_30140 (plasmid) [Rhizobium leguminosarum bv. viciae]|nr:hypothetical protein HB774_30140 [Rhizobium leguminosarum bv. viciae]